MRNIPLARTTFYRYFNNLWEVKELIEHNFVAGLLESSKGLKNLCKQMNVTKEQLIASKSNEVALGRPAYPKDIADVVSFMASEKSDYMNGQAIIIDGGTVYK